MSGGSMHKLTQITKDGMRIDVATTAPERFVVYEGMKAVPHPPASGDDAHFVVVLADAKTDMRVPYATVNATLRGPGGDKVYDERLWPMLSKTMGSHYGDNVALNRRGRYRLQLVIGPPQVGRHPEYADQWRSPMRVATTFTWKGPTGKPTRGQS